MDRVELALAGAQRAADAARGADLFDLRALVAVHALHGDVFALGHELDESLRARLDAQTARDAQAAVHDRNAVDEPDRALRTDVHAGAEAQTAVVAVLEVEPRKHGRAAVVDADVVALLSAGVAGALAADERDLAFQNFRVCAHDAADLCRDRRAADGADVDRRFSGDDRRGSRVAAREYAGAAVVAGQAFADFRFTLVDRDVEFLAEEDQTETDENTDHGDHDGCVQDRHTHAPPSVDLMTGSRTLKPMNAIAISAAASRTTGAPRSGRGRSLSLMRERMPASSTIAIV